MSDTIATVGVPEVMLGSGSVETQSPPATFSGKWEDFGKDMAAIAKEQGIVEPTQPATSAPQAVATPQSAPQVVTPPTINEQPAIITPAVIAPIVEVPDKFKGPDGKLDQEKLLKSYIEAEKTLKRAQNASQPQVEPAAPQGQPTAQLPTNLTPFEFQVAQDIYSGGGFTEQQAISMARVQVKLAEARHKAEVASTFSKVAQLEQSLEEQTRRTELTSLAKTNPEVLTPQGYSELLKIREENQWINNSPEPWKAAALILLGQKRMQEHSGSVNIPNPTGAQQMVNPLPVTPIPTATNPVILNTPKQIEAYIKTLTPEQEGEFWRKQGLKWEVPGKQYLGI